MKQIDEKYLCKSCYGCNRLLSEDFKGVYRCKNYIKGAKENGENRNTFQASKPK